MKKVVRLTESQLVNIIKKVIKEDAEASGLKDCLKPLQAPEFKECYDKHFKSNDTTGTNVLTQISGFAKCVGENPKAKAAIKEVKQCVMNNLGNPFGK